MAHHRPIGYGTIFPEIISFRIIGDAKLDYIFRLNAKDAVVGVKTGGDELVQPVNAQWGPVPYCLYREFTLRGDTNSLEGIGCDDLQN